MRIQLGSGRHYWPGFHNCDSEGRCDTITDVRKLNFPDDSAEMIYAIHLFEHLPRMEAINTLMEWKRALKPDGKLVLEMPCMDKIAKLIVDGETNIRLTLLGIFGDPREASKSMLHQWCYGYGEMTKLLETVGFKNIQIKEPRYHFAVRDMRIECTK